MMDLNFWYWGTLLGFILMTMLFPINKFTIVLVSILTRPLRRNSDAQDRKLELYIVPLLGAWVFWDLVANYIAKHTLGSEFPLLFYGVCLLSLWIGNQNSNVNVANSHVTISEMWVIVILIAIRLIN